MAAARRPARDDSTLSALVIGGTHSGAGKTSLTLGLIGALRRRGLSVQPFKVGPDFIDPRHHERASGRPPRNLDGWMLDPEVNRRRFAQATADVDVAVIEGVMGLFDGSEGGTDRGSTAEMAKMLGLDVVLVVDAGAMARSAAAVIHGFTTFDPELRVAGVVLNKVGGDVHADMIRDAVAGSAPILGALPHDPELAVPERHLGLHLPHETRGDYVERLATLVEEHIDLQALLARCRTSRSPVPPEPRSALPTVRIGVARDEAFCFYYADNLELLEDAGAELVPFSPIRDRLPDRLDGLYLGGGYPELHAEELAANEDARSAIRALALAGAPVYAECGGLMYLAEALELESGAHPMCGVLPFRTRMSAPLQIAYIDVTTTGGLFGPGRRARGHVFHQSEIVGEPEVERCFELETTSGARAAEGYAAGNVLATYAHLHFASCPELAGAFVARCGAGVA